MVEQYYELKKKHSDALILFRKGDYYISVQEDARKVAEITGVTLSRNSSDKSLHAAFPYVHLDTYLPKLIRAGHRIAICDGIFKNN